MARHSMWALGSALALAVGFFLATPCLADSSRGTSIGGNFGVGIYSNDDINDGLNEIGVDEISSGFEFGGSIRFPVSHRLALDVEAARLEGSVESDDEAYEAKISAIPVILNLYIGGIESPGAEFDFFVGAGPLIDAKFKEEGVDTGGPFEAEDSKTGFYAHGGVEGEYFVGRNMALTGRALGRLAKASDLFEDELGSAGAFDVDFNGAAFTLGLRFYFGGSSANDID